MKGFLMNLEVMEEFFTRVSELPPEQDCEKTRLKIMYDLIHEYDIKILKEKQLQDIVAGKKVLNVKSPRTTK